MSLGRGGGGTRMEAKGASIFCVVFEFFHKERQKADITKYSLLSFVGGGYTVFILFFNSINFSKKLPNCYNYSYSFI